MTARTVTPQPSPRKPPTDFHEIIADRMRRARRSSYATSLVHRHLRELARDIPRGTRAAAQRGANTARLLTAGIAAAVAAKARDPEGSAVELCEEMIRRGWLDLPRAPTALTAGAAWAMLARLTPLVTTVRRGRYRLLLQAHRGDQITDSYLRALEGRIQRPEFEAHGDASAADAEAKDADLQAWSDASAGGAAPSSHTAVPGVEDERVRAEDSPGSDVVQCGDDVGPASGGWPAAPRTAAAVAFSLRFAPREPPQPRRALSVPLTRSAWLASIPKHKHLLRAAEAALELPRDGLHGTARDVADWFAREGGRYTSRRDRAALARGLEALRRRGLVRLERGRWSVPTFEVHPALAVLDVAEEPGQRRPSDELGAMLERNGVPAAGLSHGEAVRIAARLHTRREEGLAYAGTVLRAARALARARLPVDLRELRRLDQAAARDVLERAMSARVLRESPWWP